MRRFLLAAIIGLVLASLAIADDLTSDGLLGKVKAVDEKALK